jgi:putative sterol carrier protein
MADNPDTGTSGGTWADLDFAAISPEEYAKIVKSLSKREIEELTQDTELRTRVLSEVFGRMEQQFQPESAAGLDTVIRWKITANPAASDASSTPTGSGDLVYEVAIADGACTVREGRSAADPRVTLIMGDVEFLKLTSGNASPVTMFMTRKLKIAGDVGLASGLTRLFNIPKP